MTCVFSRDRAYRYVLWREWEWAHKCEPVWGSCKLRYDHKGPHNASARVPYLLVIGLNPSTADETKDDPTIRRCIGFAKRWGYGALCMVNVYAFRATNPKHMLAAKDPVGPDNDRWLDTCAKDAGRIIAAWGRNAHPDRDAEVTLRISKTKGMWCLGRNKDDSPRHPLYVPANYEPEEYF